MQSIKQFCEQLGVSRTTVLYYERQGLIAPASRTSSGYRLYGASEIETFKVILAYRSYGISVSEIKELMQQSQGRIEMRFYANSLPHSISKSKNSANSSTRY